MGRYEHHIELVSAAAAALGPYRSKVVFVGGAVSGLLMTNRHFQDVRPTEDVDVIIEAASYGKYAQLQDELRGLGFSHDMNGPLCRFQVSGITVDVMPTEGSILGFSNRWYPFVIETDIPHVLPNLLEIRLISAPMFLCTKLEAYADRGGGDFLVSPDMEDIVAVINGRDAIVDECRTMPRVARDYLAESFRPFRDNVDFQSGLAGILPAGAANRVDIVQSRIGQLAGL